MWPALCSRTEYRAAVIKYFLGALLILSVSSQEGPNYFDGNFVRMGFHSSAVIGNTLYVDGGQINYLVDNAQTGPLPLNYTLAIELQQSWTKNPEISTIAKDAGQVPSSDYAALWAQNGTGTIYSFGGVPVTSPNLIPNLYAHDSGGWHTVQQGQGEAAPGLGNPRPAAGSSTFGNGVGYMLGGYNSSGDTGEWNQNWPLPGLISYNMTSNSWLNISSGPISPFGTSLLGALEFVPNFGSEGVLIAMGGQYSDNPSKLWTAGGGNGGGNFPFSNITIFDVASATWYWQIATGDIPPSRSLFCSTGVESTEGTFEIFVYGGNNNAFVLGDVYPTNETVQAQEIFNTVYVLSLPGFVWFKSNDTSAQPRTLHSCNTIGNRQMVSIGGLNPTLFYGSAFNGTNDTFYNGIGIFDMVELQWKSNYDAQAAPYSLPTPIQDWYDSSSSNPPMTWNNPTVKELFTAHNISTTSTNPTVSASVSASAQAASLSPGAIAGAVVGGVAGAALIAAAAWFLCVRGRRSGARGGPVAWQDEHKKFLPLEAPQGVPMQELTGHSRLGELSTHAAPQALTELSASE